MKRVHTWVLIAVFAVGCADSNAFTEGAVGVWRLDDSALVFGSFRTDPSDCEAFRVGQCERLGECRSRLAVASAGTMTVDRNGDRVGTAEPNADGLYLLPLDEGGDVGDLWRVGFQGAEVEALELTAMLPPPVSDLTARRDGDLVLEWASPPNADSVLIELSSPTDEAVDIQCEVPRGATRVTVDAMLLDGASNLTASVTAYAEDRAPGVLFRVGEPSRISVP